MSLFYVIEGGDWQMAGNMDNLVKNEDLTPEERRERASKAGKASVEARRRKKTLKNTLNAILEMDVVGENNKQNLKRFGIKEEDQNYQTALAVRVVQKALVDGDTNAMRFIAEVTGDMNRFGIAGIDDDIVEMKAPPIIIPDNGRDARPANEIAPQAGPQTMFMASSADIVVYGGAAGGGKTYAILMEMLRHKDVKGFNAAIFRHNFKQVTSPGGLWDSADALYSNVIGAEPRKTPDLHWEFSGMSKLSFAHIERDADLKSWQGSQICYIGFDELTHFTKHQFLYMLSRNRTTCGVKPYVRATCNPDSDSWVAEFIKWWIDQDTGYAIPERSGQIRWMVNMSDTIYWFDKKEEGIAFAHKNGLKDEEAEFATKSVTFIASSLEDNKILMESNPGYKANLLAMSEVDKERLLRGNWKIKPSAGKYFKRAQFTLLETVPDDIIYWCRAWDLAATDEDENGNADYTSGVLMGKRKCGRYIILNVINERIKAGDVAKLILNTSIMDKAKYGFLYTVHIPQDPGAAGKIVATEYVKMLAGFNVVAEGISGSKELRATPLAVQVQNGNVDVLVGEWNEMYFSQLESFPESSHDDMVDASSDSFNELVKNTFNLDNLI